MNAKSEKSGSVNTKHNSTMIGTNSQIEADYSGSKTIGQLTLSTVNSPDKYLDESFYRNSKGSKKKKSKLRNENPGYCGPSGGGGCTTF